MPRKNKKTTFTSLLMRHKVLAFLVGFAIIGSLIVIVRAATSVSEDLYTSSNLAYSYSSGGSTTIERNSSGEIIAYSRPRSIDISKNGYIYCTPPDKANVTYRELAAKEKDYLSNDLFYTRPTEAVDPASDGPFIADQPTLYIDGFKTGLNGATYSESDYPEIVKASSKYLEQLCDIPGEPIPSGDSLNIILSRAETKAGEWYQPVAELLAAKAYAGGQPSSSGKNYKAINVDFEAHHHVTLANARKLNGKLATQGTDCLNTAAREWTKEMVDLNILKHSSPINILPERNCGGGWTKLGENVGVVGLQKPNDRDSSLQSSQAVFDAFMRSENHKKNILDPQFTHHGIGAYTTSDGKRIFVTQVFWQGKALPK